MNITQQFNTTMDMTFTSFSILPIAILVLAVVAIIAAVMVLSSPAWLKKILKIREFLLKTFGYFFYGAGTLLILGGFYLAFSIITKDISKGGVILKPLAGIVAAFFGVSALGYLVKKYAVDRISLACKKVDEMKKKEVEDKVADGLKATTG